MVVKDITFKSHRFGFQSRRVPTHSPVYQGKLLSLISEMVVRILTIMVCECLTEKKDVKCFLALCLAGDEFSKMVVRQKKAKFTSVLFQCVICLDLYELCDCSHVPCVLFPHLDCRLLWELVCFDINSLILFEFHRTFQGRTLPRYQIIIVSPSASLSS